MNAQEIRERRLAYPLTVGELAARVGVSEQAIRAWERGDRHPRPRHVRALKAVFERDRDCACHTLPRSTAAGQAWTADEEDDLRRLVESGLAPDAVTAALNQAHGRRRTMAAVGLRVQRLGMSFWQVYSARQVAGLLGVPYHRVDAWIAASALPAMRSVERKYGQPTRWWRIAPADLEAFVDRHAGVEFDPSAVRDPKLRERAVAANRGQAV